MNPKQFVSELEAIGVANIGRTYLFGSFANNDGNNYNDIDIYIDADALSIPEIERCLELLPYDYTVVPQYYSPGPKPTPKPPFPFPIPPKTNTNDMLHVTVCNKEEAKIQPFYQTMIEGKHYVLCNENA